MINKNQTWIGIDLNQDKINIHIQPENKNFQIDNDNKGINTLMDQLIPIQPASIILQRAQGREANLTSQLVNSAFPLIVIHSDNAKRLIIEADIETKTSQVNAKDLANLGKHIDSKKTRLNKQIKSQLNSLSSLNNQLKEMITEDQLQLAIIGDTNKESLSQHIRWLEEQLSDNNQKLLAIIDEIEDQQEVNIKNINQSSNSNPQSSKQISNQTQKVTKYYRGQVYQENKGQAINSIQQQLGNQGIPTKKITKYYRGQSYEVEVPDYAALARMKQERAQNN